jgi:zinc D-Ala-D-Ala carboxypeptidase
MWASAYFKYEEFDSPDEPGSGINMDASFIGALERVRERCAFPFIITSGYRTPSHNAVVGGKRDSAHLKGLAADILISDCTRRFDIVKAALALGFRRLEIGRDWVHLDCDLSLDQDVLFLP